jgi:tRNA(Ile)-lysidine synthase TilS/MesJ
MALVYLLCHLAPHHPLELVVGHCDHGMRPDAAANARHVERAAAALGLPFVAAQASPGQLTSEVRGGGTHSARA